MAELSWQPTIPLGRSLTAGRHGAQGPAGVRLVELSDFELIQVMARRGQSANVAAAAAEKFGAAPPAKPEALTAVDAILIWSGPDQFLALRRRASDSSLLDTARQAFAGIASISDQSDGRALIRISGPKARQVLAKCCSLDSHPKIFAPGAAAQTSVDHTPVTLWRGKDDDGAPAFFLLLFSTFAVSLLRTILDAAAEYGVETSASEAWQP